MTKASATAFERGRKAHPKLDLGEVAFRRFLARALDGCADRSFEEVEVEDLFLACACAENVAGAAKSFEARFEPIIRRSVARIFPEPAERDEAVQRVREHLLVGAAAGQPKIAMYRGAGPLEGWVAVASIRLAVSMGRGQSAERRLRAAAAQEVAGGDPEILLMKHQIRRELERAVAAALSKLNQRDRLVLRLYLVSGMTLAGIGRSLGVTQQAVSRQLAKARARILDEVCRGLGDRLKVPRGEFSSLLRAVQSRLDVSLSRLLATE